MKNDYFCHKSAIIDPGATIGAGTKIWHFCHVMKTAVIGQNCIIGQNCFVAGKVGNNCKLQNNVSIYDGVILDDWVFCGPSMTFTNDINPRAKYPKKRSFTKTHVSRGATIGANATIICGIDIGKWAFVGAGSIVTKDISDYALVYGTPATIKGWMCECGRKLPKKFHSATCQSCGKNYKKTGMRVQQIT